MGQGCNNSSINLFEKQIPDTQVKYTGAPIAALGICTGDLLSEVEAVMLQKIIDYATGVGISIPSIDLTTCGAFAGCIDCCGTCTDLPCLLKCYRDTICTIWGDVETLKEDVYTLLNGPYITGCLTNVTSSSTLSQIIQELITEFCTVKAQVALLQTSVNSFIGGINGTIGNFLSTHLKSCQGQSVLGLTGTGASTTFNFKGFVPIGGIMPWAGDTVGKFDSTGLGINGTDWCGWAICNGQNNTPNMLGLVPVMATNVSVGTAPQISGQSFAYGTIGGRYNHTLTAAESGTGAHSHVVTDPGHDHGIEFGNHTFPNVAGANNAVDFTQVGNHTSWRDAETGVYQPASNSSYISYVMKAKTGITVGPATGANASAAHTNVQPYIALYYIQRVN